MRKDITIAAEVRESRGKNEARRLRAAGRIPAVVYGAGVSAIALTVNPKEVNKILHSATGHNTIFNLRVSDGETTPVMMVAWQSDPIRDTLLHVDLERIDLKRKIKVKVPIHAQGEPKGVKQQGGIFEIVTREVEIECLPDDIPDEFRLDVSELMMSENKRATEIPLSGSMRLLTHLETVLVHVVPPRGTTTETVEGAEPAAAVAEPEVIKKGKKEEALAAEGKDKDKDKKKK